MRLIKPAAATLAIAMAATTFASTADAQRHHRFFHHHRSFHHGGAFGAGVAGFAAGALLGSLTTPSYGYYGDYYDYGYAPGYYYQRPTYYAPRAYYRAPRTYYRTPRAYYSTPRAYYTAPRAYYSTPRSRVRGYEQYGCSGSDGAVSRPANALC